MAISITRHAVLINVTLVIEARHWHIVWFVVIIDVFSDNILLDAFGSFITILAHSCWKQWMRYRGGADVDGSCRPWTEVVFRKRKLHCGPWTEVGSQATHPLLVKVKINFDEAQKFTWKEITCLYGLIKKKQPQITFANFWKCNLNREAEMFTPKGPVAGSFQHTLPEEH